MGEPNLNSVKNGYIPFIVNTSVEKHESISSGVELSVHGRDNSKLKTARGHGEACT